MICLPCTNELQKYEILKYKYVQRVIQSTSVTRFDKNVEIYFCCNFCYLKAFKRCEWQNNLGIWSRSLQPTGLYSSKCPLSLLFLCKDFFLFGDLFILTIFCLFLSIKNQASKICIKQKHNRILEPK